MGIRAAHAARFANGDREGRAQSRARRRDREAQAFRVRPRRAHRRLAEAEAGEPAGIRDRQVPPGSSGIDALLVGYYNDSGLRFAGKVRAGFVPHLRREVFKALNPHHVDECPYVDLPNSKSSRWGGGVTADEMREMQWVKPELVAQIRFVEWTAEGRLRHAAFLGLRSDKSAREVRREWPGSSGG